MANVIELKLNNTTLTLTADKYKTSYKSVDALNTSEAGTTIRSVIRTGILTMDIGYKCDAAEKKLLDGWNKASSLTCKYYDEETSAVKTWTCFMSNYSADLIMETSTTRFYKVSFKLNDLEA